MNPYPYVLNNPFKYVDPLGLNHGRVLIMVNDGGGSSKSTPSPIVNTGSTDVVTVLKEVVVSHETSGDSDWSCKVTNNDSIKPDILVTLSSIFINWIDPSKLPSMMKSDNINGRPEGWTYTDINNRVHIRDANKNIRVRLDPPDAKTPYDHAHIYDENGNPLDKDLKSADRKSPDVHHKYKGPNDKDDNDPPGTGGTGDVAYIPKSSSDQNSNKSSIVDDISKATGFTGAALIIYIIISEGSRILFPPRNLVPVP